MKEILCDDQIFLKLKAVDSYCSRSDIGLVVLDEYLLEPETITRIIANHWHEHNQYILILRNELTQKKIKNIMNSADQQLVSQIWIPESWDEKQKNIIFQYCKNFNIELKENVLSN